jgi:plasmid stabilization system protein ParE
MIVFSQEAASDIERVREFLNVNNPEAAKRALRTIFAALERVQEFPGLGRPTEDADIRQSLFPLAPPVISFATRYFPKPATYSCCASGTAAKRGCDRG